jgi:hypothetical protein
MSHHQQRRLAQKVLNRKHPTVWVAWLGLFGWHTLTATAQIVYRCGDAYSTSASCSDDRTPTVHDPRNTDQAKSQDRLTHQTQVEAETLEKRRIKAEQSATRAMPPVPAWSTKDISSTHDATDSNMPMQPTHAHRKSASPYFTAKDGTTPSRKTPHPSIRKPAGTDAAQKP